MKNKLFLLLIATVCYAIPSLAQNNTIPAKTTFTPPTVTPHINKVFSVTVSVDSSTTSSTARAIYLKLTFKSIGTGNITYTLTDVDRQASGTSTSTTNGTLTPNGTGTDIVLIKRVTFIRSSHAYTVTTTSPNQVSSTP